MRIAALETSTELCSVALWLDGRLLSAREPAGQRHSEWLLPMLDGLLAEAGIKLKDLDGIAFGSGPGSFTGLRIACGVTQGLAFGAGLPVLGISTLLAMAEASALDRVLACLDARMGEVYLAAHEQTAQGWATRIEACLVRPEQAPELPGPGWTGCGSGFSAHGATLAQRYGGQLVGAQPERFPEASAIARLAAPLFAAGRGLPAERALPVYLRDKVALKVRER